MCSLHLYLLQKTCKKKSKKSLFAEDKIVSAFFLCAENMNISFFADGVRFFFFFFFFSLFTNNINSSFSSLNPCIFLLCSLKTYRISSLFAEDMNPSLFAKDMQISSLFAKGMQISNVFAEDIQVCLLFLVR